MNNRFFSRPSKTSSYRHSCLSGRNSAESQQTGDVHARLRAASAWSLASASLLAAVIAIAPAASLWAADPLAAARTDTWTPPKTAWASPDLRGVWDFRTITPLERPTELSGKDILSDQEAAEFATQTLKQRNKDRRTTDGLTVREDVRNAYNQFWWDYGDKLTEDKRTSLIVDPPDGRIPSLTPLAQKRYDEIQAARDRPAHSPVDRGVAERCLLGFNAGPPYTPSAYNNNVHIFQTPGYAVLLIEMVNDARVVPLDGRPHPPEVIRQWRGDARGHWEGNTLVVESANFTDKTTFRGSGRNMRLTERFTRVGPERIRYEYTIDDPESFTKLWTAVIPMKKTDQPMFEYACHEGNYAMLTMLEGARAEDKAAEEAAKKGSSEPAVP